MKILDNVFAILLGIAGITAFIASIWHPHQLVMALVCIPFYLPKAVKFIDNIIRAKHGKLPRNVRR